MWAGEVQHRRRGCDMDPCDFPRGTGSAAAALRKIADPRAPSALQQRLRLETDDETKRPIQQAINTIRAKTKTGAGRP